MKASHDATGRGLHPAAARGKLGSNAAPGIVTVSNLQLLNAPIGIQPRLEARALFRGDERRDGAAGQQAGRRHHDGEDDLQRLRERGQEGARQRERRDGGADGPRQAEGVREGHG